MSYIWCTATICVRFSCGTTGLDKAQQFAYTDSRLCVHHELNQFIPFQTVTGVLDVSGIHYHFPNKNQCLRSYQSNLSFMTTNRNTAMQSMQTLILVSLPCLSNSRSPLSKHHSQMRCFERYKTGQESLTLAENRKILTDPLLYYEC